MTITTLIIIGTLISFVIIYITLNFDKINSKKKYKHQDLIDIVHSRIAKANGASIKHFSLENSVEDQRIEKENLYKNADFINKHCTNLEDFIISDEMNGFDLMKLAELNQIRLQISEGWYPLTLQLIKELNENGWDKKVSCIKEKYARLEFYTRYEYTSPISKIISKYSKSSENICETCGERGEIRYNSGWDYVACRNHYLQNRGKIILEKAGFNHNGIGYLWSDVKDALFEDLDFKNRYKFLIIEYNNDNIKHQGWTDNKLYVSKNTVGYGNFIKNLPKDLPSLNHDYVKHFEDPDFCEICGYQAVYNEECECCENETWKSYQKRYNNLEDSDEEDSHEEHIKYYQIQWVIDEGEIYESKFNNYAKNPDYKILFTESDVNEYLKYLKEEDD